MGPNHEIGREQMAEMKKADRSSKMPEKQVCEFMGSNYTEGQEICEPEKCIVCRDGAWEELNVWRPKIRSDKSNK